MLEHIEDYMGPGVLQQIDKVIVKEEEDEVLKILDLYHEQKSELEVEVEEDEEEESSED